MHFRLVYINSFYSTTCFENRRYLWYLMRYKNLAFKLFDWSRERKRESESSAGGTLWRGVIYRNFIRLTLYHRKNRT